jgi:hypothetical protein
VRARAVGFHDGTGEIEIAAGEALRRCDIELRSTLMIVVRLVLPDGRAVDYEAERELRTAGCLAVVATREPLARLPLTNLQVVEESEIGSFRRVIYRESEYTYPPAGAIGILEAREPPPFHVTAVLRQSPLASVVVTEPVPEVTLVVQPEAIRATFARVRARVIDAATGAPLTDGLLALNDRQMGGGGETPDADGVVVFEPVAPGLLVLEPEFQGYESTRRYVAVRPGSDQDLGTIALDRAVAIAGTVRDGNGDPLDAWITWHDLEQGNDAQPLDVGLQASTDETGAFRIRSAGRARHLLVFHAKGLARTARIVDTSAGPVEDLDVRMTPGVPVTLAVDCAPGLLLQIRDGAGRPVVAMLSSGRAGPPVPFEPGAYVARLFDDGLLRFETSFQVGAEPLTVSITDG